MRGKLKKEGTYELFETTRKHQILSLDEKEWYAVVEGQKGDIIVYSDSDHEKSRTLQKGRYLLADFEDDPEFNDLPHLFMEKGSGYLEFILPNGLPTKKDHQKKLVRPGNRVAKQKVQEHVKGEGNKGTEKKYTGKPEQLRMKSRDKLYRQAKKEGIKGRSKMSKEELVKHLKEE